MEAENEQAVVRRLQHQGLLPLSARPVRIRLGLHRIRRPAGSTQETVRYLAEELATLLEAGLPLDHALRLTAESGEGLERKSLVKTLQARVQAGEPLSTAMAAAGGDFSPLQVSMVKAGETAGKLAPALKRLAEQLERSQALRNRIRSALFYPVLLLVVAAVSVLSLLLFVVPRFGQMFQEMGQPLPLATRLAVETGYFLQAWWWLLLLIAILLGLWLERQLAAPATRERWQRSLLRWPLLGSLTTRLETARFSRTLALLLESGIPLHRAVQLASESVANSALRQALLRTQAALKAGRGLGCPLEMEGLFPAMATRMIRVGEESGDLPAMLHRIADDQEKRLEQSMNQMLILLEPLLIIGLGLLVAGIIASILMAVLDANQLLL